MQRSSTVALCLSPGVRRTPAWGIRDFRSTAIAAATGNRNPAVMPPLLSRGMAYASLSLRVVRQASEAKSKEVEQPRDIMVAEHRVATASLDETVFERAEQPQRSTMQPQAALQRIGQDARKGSDERSR